MPIRSRENLFGAYAFLFGIVVALAVGIIPVLIGQPAEVVSRYIGWIYSILAVTGVLVGASNFGSKDLKTFLIASLSVVFVGYMGLSSINLMKGIVFVNINVGLILISIFNALMILFVPVTIIVALRTVFSIASVGE